jgi:hypothetical protein
MSELADMIRNSPEVQAFVRRESEKVVASLARDADAWESFIRAAERLTVRMVAGGHWTI